MELTRAHVWISGRVQGVGYRFSTEREALQRGLKGWVRNLADGRVEAVFEGPQAQVDAMIDWCNEGPPAARVEAVEVTYEVPEHLTDFMVKR